MEKLAQSTSHLIMVRPHHFGFNEQTSGSNVFQTKTLKTEDAENSRKAIKEFDQMVEALRKNGVNVIAIQDTPDPATPDSIFPNNWITLSHDGTIRLFPMEAENRRAERRMDIIQELEHDFVIHNIYDISGPESEGRYLEGTGSVIFDHINKVAYAAISSRTDRDLFEELCEAKNYEGVSFESNDPKGIPIYHTNVIMCIGTKVAVLCSECISDDKKREAVLEKLRSSGRTVIEISFDQVLKFAGNMLEVQNKEGSQFLLMSTQAYEALTEEQRETILQFQEIIHSPLPTIEKLGGGSARCMVAEIFLPPK